MDVSHETGANKDSTREFSENAQSDLFDCKFDPDHYLTTSEVAYTTLLTPSCLTYYSELL